MLTKRIFAELILFLHGAIVLFLVFGLLLVSIWKIYLVVLVATIATYPIFKGCVLSQWEFKLRKQINPEVNYDGTWLGYYAPSILKNLPNIFWEMSSMLFLVCALGTVVYSHFF